MPEIDIVVSGGAIDALCDSVGFIKALTSDLGFTISSAAGTSAGGVIIGAYAANKSIKEIEKLVLDTTFTNWINMPRWWNWIKIYKAIRYGYISDGQEISKCFNNITNNKLFKHSTIDLHLAGTDVGHHQVRGFNKVNDPDMPIALAMQITCCVPGCFKPPYYNGTIWYDGSIRSHYPVEILPISPRPLYGFLSAHTDQVEENMRSMSGIFGTLAQLADNTIDINVKYSTTVAKRQPLTVLHPGVHHGHDWGICKSDRVKMIEAARIATIKAISPTL